MEKSRRRYTGAWSELLFASVPVTLFATGGVYSLCRRGESPSRKDLLVFAVLCIAFCANVCLAAAERRGCRAARPAKRRDRRALVLLLAAALVLRLPQLGTLPRNDSSLYYRLLYGSCWGFDLALSFWRDHFALAAHPTFGPASLAALLEFFFPGNINNIWLFQTALSLGAVFCLYDILERELDTKCAFWGALAVSCSPMFLGLVSCFQPDFGPAVFFFYVIWAFYRKKYVLLAWFSLLLVWSKEFGVVLLVGFFLGVFFYSLAALFTGSFRQRLYAALHDARLVWLCFLCLIGGLGMLYYLSGSAWLDFSPFMSGRAHSKAAASAVQNGFGHLGWDLGYTGFKLVEWLSVNFVWLATIPVLCLALRALWARAAKKSDAPRLPAGLRLIAAGTVGSALLYFLFSCLVVTATLPRYNLILEMLAFFWAALAVVSLGGPDKRFFRPAAAAFCALLAVQAYWTVDPVMYVLYPQVETGGIPLADLNSRAVRWYSDEDWNSQTEWLGDYVMYNAQYRYLDKCLDRMLAAEQYDRNTDILQVGEERGLQFGGTYNLYYWDDEKLQFTVVAGEHTLVIRPLILAAGSDQLQQLYASGTLHQRAIIVLPLSVFGKDAVQKEFEENLPAFYTNVQRHEIRCLPAGVLPYYTADLVPPGA